MFPSFLYSFGGLKILFSDWPSKSGTAMKLIDMDSVGWNRSAIHGKLLYLFQKRKKDKKLLTVKVSESYYFQRTK